jgi:hypothetical protein
VPVLPDDIRRIESLFHVHDVVDLALVDYDEIVGGCISRRSTQALNSRSTIYAKSKQYREMVKISEEKDAADGGNETIVLETKLAGGDGEAEWQQLMGEDIQMQVGRR